MARIRTIKPEFWRDEDLSALPAETALLAIGLLNHADDEGYFNAHPKLIESDIFPLRELYGSVTVMLSELAGIGYIRLFEGADSKRYGLIVNFAKHQVINKKIPSKIKHICTKELDYRSPTVVLPSGKEQGKEQGKEMEEKPIFPEADEKAEKPTRSQGSRFPPDFEFPDEWRAWAKTERSDVDPDDAFSRFRDYWISQPGVKGRKTDWFATWRNWIRSTRKEEQRNGQQFLPRETSFDRGVRERREWLEKQNRLAAEGAQPMAKRDWFA